jgi:hypothetical protein
MDFTDILQSSLVFVPTGRLLALLPTFRGSSFLLHSSLLTIRSYRRLLLFDLTNRLFMSCHRTGGVTLHRCYHKQLYVCFGAEILHRTARSPAAREPCGVTCSRTRRLPHSRTDGLEYVFIWSGGLVYTRALLHFLTHMLYVSD